MVVWNQRNHQLGDFYQRDCRSRRDGSGVWRSGSKLSIHATAMGGFRVHVWLHVLGSRQAARQEALAGEINWIEKTITATAVTVGYFAGQAPLRLMALIMLTNWLWIPVILAYDIAQGRALRVNPSQS